MTGASRDGSEERGTGMSPRTGRDTLSPRERVGVREPVSTLAIAAMERFIESQLFEIDLLTDLEPGNPGGETPPSTAGGTPAATEARFMESALFEIDLLTDHVPGEVKGRLRTRLRLRRERRFMERAFVVASPA